MNYLYAITDLYLSFETPYAVHIGKESEPFLIEYNSAIPCDWHFEFCQEEKLLGISPEAHRQICFWYQPEDEEHKTWFCAAKDREPYAMTRWNEQEHYTRCSFKTGCESYINYSRNFCEIMSLEWLLLQFQGFILHASFIRYQDCGILFSAPSGVGKSTQADLWAKYKEAEILNGDRAGIRQVDGTWRAYGLPFAGSSGIYRNESAKVKAIVVLAQAKENKIRKLSKLEAMTSLFPEVAMHGWDKTFVEKIFEIIKNILQDIPVYRLECLPNQSAVELLHHTLFGKELDDYDSSASGSTNN